ncbi:hypothetical protein VTK56DRAFT_908 [Thermocarpiscus australiensis]
MDRQDQIINFAPYFPPAPSPLGLQGRRLTRHSFLSNRWGLQSHGRGTGEMSGHGGRHRLFFANQRTSSPLNTNSKSIQVLDSKIDRNFRVLRVDLHGVENSVRQLEQTVEKIPEQLIKSVVEGLRKIHDAQKANLEMKHRLETESLLRSHALDRERLEQMERDLQSANARAAKLANDLAKQRQQLTSAIKHMFGKIPEDTDMTIRINLGPLPDGSDVVDGFCPPQIWNSASVQQRQGRVAAVIFHLLFRRILRPGLRMFGIHEFVRGVQRKAISASESLLRALEKELETHGVNNETLTAWIASTIDITSPLTDIEHSVEGVRDEIFEALSPVRQFQSTRNTSVFKNKISAICQEAVRLKLAMRRAPGGYKIEVPSQDAKKWGEPGCDQETRALSSGLWLHVTDHEVSLDAEEERGWSGDIACIPFGALTKLEKDDNGNMRKVVLEKAWVISRGNGSGKVNTGTKRKASAVDAQDQPPSKRTSDSTNSLVPAEHIRRFKALMGDD